MKRVLVALLALTPLCGCGDLPVTEPGADGGAAAAAPRPSGDFLHGRMVIRAAPNGRDVLVFVDGAERRGIEDGVVDQIFVLQRDRETALAPVVLSDAALRYAGDALVVRERLGGATVVLRLEDAAAIDAEVDESATVHLGYGLARRADGGRLSIPEVAGVSLDASLLTCGGVQAQISKPTDHVPVCHAGGEGASGCSSGCGGGGDSCSVSCSEGTYACCDKLYCTCTCER